MKVFKNRALAVLMALCMMLSLLPVTAMAAEGVKYLKVSRSGKNITWTDDETKNAYKKQGDLYFAIIDGGNDLGAKLKAYVNEHTGFTPSILASLNKGLGLGALEFERLNTGAVSTNQFTLSDDQIRRLDIDGMWLVIADLGDIVPPAVGNPRDPYDRSVLAIGCYSPLASDAGTGDGNGDNSGGSQGAGGGQGSGGQGSGGQDAEDNRPKLESLTVNNGANLITKDTYGTGDGTWGDPWDVSAVIGKDKDSFTFKAEFNDTDANAYYRLMPVDNSVAAPQLVSGKPVTINLNEKGKAEVMIAFLPKGVTPAGGNPDAETVKTTDRPEPTSCYRLTVTNTGGSGNQGSGNHGSGNQGSGGDTSRPSTKQPSGSSTPTTPSTPATPTTPSTVGGFSDVPAGNTFATQIAWAQANGYMGGYSDGTFRPNANTTRQALWMVLGRIAGAAPADMAAAREWAVSAGISDGTGADGNMSRQQMITMLYRFAQSQGRATSGSADLSGYSDSGIAASYAKEALAWGVANGIITGTTDGKLNPEGVATRAHFAAFLYRYCNLA